MPSDDPAAAPLPLGLRRPISRLRRTTVPIGTLAARVGGFGRYLGVGLRTRPATTATAGSLSSVRVPDGAWSLWRADDDATGGIVAPDPAMAAIAARYQQRARRAPAAPPVPRGIPSVLRRKAQSRSGPATGPSALAGRLRPTDTPVPRNEGHGAGVAAAAERNAAPGRAARGTGFGSSDRTGARRPSTRSSEAGAPVRGTRTPTGVASAPAPVELPAGPAPTGAGAAAAAAFAARFAAAFSGDAGPGDAGPGEATPPGLPSATPGAGDRPAPAGRGTPPRSGRFGRGAPWSALASLARADDDGTASGPERDRHRPFPAERTASRRSGRPPGAAGGERSAVRSARPDGDDRASVPAPAGPSTAVRRSAPLDGGSSSMRPPAGSASTSLRATDVVPRDAVPRDTAGADASVRPVDGAGGTRPLPMALAPLTPAGASPLDRLPVDAGWLPRGVALLERPPVSDARSVAPSTDATTIHRVVRSEAPAVRDGRHRAVPTGRVVPARRPVPTGRPVVARPLRRTADVHPHGGRPTRGVDRVSVLGVVRPVGSSDDRARARHQPSSAAPAPAVGSAATTGAGAGAAAAWAARLADAWGAPAPDGASGGPTASLGATPPPARPGRVAPAAATIATAEDGARGAHGAPAPLAARRADPAGSPALAVRRVPVVVARLAALLPRAAAVAGVVVAPSPLAPAPGRSAPFGAPTGAVPAWSPTSRGPAATAIAGAGGRPMVHRSDRTSEPGPTVSRHRETTPAAPAAPVAPRTARAAGVGRPRPLYRTVAGQEPAGPVAAPSTSAAGPRADRRRDTHVVASDGRAAGMPADVAGPFAVSPTGVVSPVPSRGPFAVSPSGVVTSALPVRPAAVSPRSATTADGPIAAPAVRPTPPSAHDRRSPGAPTPTPPSAHDRRWPAAPTPAAAARVTRRLAEAARRTATPIAATATAPSPVAQLTSRPAHRRHALAAHLAQVGARRGRALPTSFRPLARLLGDAPVEVRHDAGAREALRRAGRPAATIGSTILLDRAPSDAPVMVERLAHELVHASERRPSPPRLFDDPQRDHEERRAHTIGRLARSLGPEAVPAALGTAGALPVRLSAIDGPASPAGTGTVTGASGGVTSDPAPFARSAVRRSASTGAASRSTVRRSAASTGGAADAPETGGTGPAPVVRRSATTTVARRSPAAATTAAPRVERATATRAPRESATARLDRVDELVAMVEARVIAELERRGGRHRGWL